MSWYFFAFLAPALWAVSSHIDKYILSRYLKNGSSGAIAIFAGLIGLVFSVGVFIFAPTGSLEIEFWNGIFIVLNGALLIIAFIPYYYALAEDEASIVRPLYQTIPIFTYILGYFVLGETLTRIQLFAGILIIIGAAIISLDFSQKKIRIKKKIMLLMLLSSFLIAMHFLIFKFVALQENFWSTSFWEYIGSVLVGIFLLVFIKKFRQQFWRILSENKISVVVLNAVNEIINIAAKLLVSFASLLVPLAIVTVANGVQPFFVFAYGLILTLFFPSIATEKIEKRHLVQKLLAIAIMACGTYLLVGFS